MKKAFSLFEIIIAIALSGVMALLFINYVNYDAISKQNIKTSFQIHIQTITEAILQCKTLSNSFPTQSNGSPASSSILSSLDCNTTTPYPLDGGKGIFIPKPLSNFDTYTATQNGAEFYFSTSVTKNTLQADVLLELNSSYSKMQYEIIDKPTKYDLKFYLSR